MKNRKASMGVILVVIIIIVLVGIMIWYYSSGSKPIVISHPNVSSTVVANGSSTNHLPLYIEYAIGGNSYLSVTDPNGKQFGKNPITGIKYTDISNGGQDDSNPKETFLYVDAPVAGQYIVKVGGPRGTFELATMVADGIHPPIPQIVTGTISQAGQTTTYIQNYDPNNFASSTLFAASSTN